MDNFKVGDKVVRSFDLYRNMNPVIVTVTEVQVTEDRGTFYKLDGNVRFIYQSYISKLGSLKIA